MQNKKYKQAQSYMEKNLNIEEKEDYIIQYFKKRNEEIQETIINNKEYKKHNAKLKDINKKICHKFKNNKEIIKAIEEYENTSRAMSSIYEEIMYKFGIYDALTFITKGTEQLNVNKYIEENYDK